MKSSFKKINAAVILETHLVPFKFLHPRILRKGQCHATMAFHYIRGSINNDVGKGKHESHNFIYTMQFVLK